MLLCIAGGGGPGCTVLGYRRLKVEVLGARPGPGTGGAAPGPGGPRGPGGGAPAAGWLEKPFTSGGCAGGGPPGRGGWGAAAAPLEEVNVGGAVGGARLGPGPLITVPPFTRGLTVGPLLIGGAPFVPTAGVPIEGGPAGAGGPTGGPVASLAGGPTGGGPPMVCLIGPPKLGVGGPIALCAGGPTGGLTRALPGPGAGPPNPPFTGGRAPGGPGVRGGPRAGRGGPPGTKGDGGGATCGLNCPDTPDPVNC